MRTLIVSDIHLGSRQDLLRRPELREPLMAALGDADRLIINGDGLELREVPVRDAAEHAKEFLDAAARALGPDGEIVMLAGNHDHGLVAGWSETQLMQAGPGSLRLEHRIAPREAGPLAAALAEHAAPARLELAYPGVWVREDVYAFHGHYADVHATVPTFERLAAGAMARWVSPIPERGAGPDHYEAVLAPIYAWMHALVQRSNHGVVKAGASNSARAWVALAGEGRQRHPLRAAALGGGYAAAVGAINRLGIGPVRRDLSGPALRQGYLHGIGEVIRRLGIGAEYVIWGHSHRGGPWPHDDPAEWVTASGSRIVNSGSWVYQRHFLGDGPHDSPYWPGTAVVVEDAGAPQLVRLLADRDHAELAPRPG